MFQLPTAHRYQLNHWRHRHRHCCHCPRRHHRLQQLTASSTKPSVARWCCLTVDQRLCPGWGGKSAKRETATQTRRRNCLHRAVGRHHRGWSRWAPAIAKPTRRRDHASGGDLCRVYTYEWIVRNEKCRVNLCSYLHFHALGVRFRSVELNFMTHRISSKLTRAIYNDGYRMSVCLDAIGFS